MRMVIGGAYQGQLDWAKANYKDVNWVSGRECAFDAIYTCEGIYDFHEYIKRLMQQEPEKTQNLAEEIINKNPNLIVVSNEIGYGLVPVDSFDREYREQTGRICTKLAAYSEQVVRVVLGIGTVIK